MDEVSAGPGPGHLAAQIPETLHTVWDRADWIYNPSNGRIVNRADSTRLIPYNYVVFSVSRYEGA